VTTPAAQAQQSFDKKAAALAKLRAEVEQLESQIQNERAASAAEIKALAAQKGELSLLVRKEQIRVDALRREHARQLTRLRAASAKASKLAPALLSSLTPVEDLVKSSLPFKRTERLADLDKIRRGLRRQTLTPQTAASQLWQFIEDELELCRDSGQFRQSITLDGGTVLADVIRLGMVALLFRTSDGRHGHAERQKDGVWRFTRAPPGGALEQGIRALFEAFKKQIRSGVFKVPLPPMPAGGGAR
jgi:hypothetical protein